jgi:hypothetical protein
MRGTNRRQYFTESELNKLISAARKGRHGQRDATHHGSPWIAGQRGR